MLVADGEVPTAARIATAFEEARATAERVLLVVAPPRRPRGSSFYCFIICFEESEAPTLSTGDVARATLAALPTDVPVTVLELPDAGPRTLRQYLAGVEQARRSITRWRAAPH